MTRHSLPAGVLVLITVLAVSIVACAGSAPPHTAAAPPSPPMTAAAVLGASVVDTPTKHVAITPTAPGRDVEQESDVTPTRAAPEMELSAEAKRVVQLASQDLAQRLGLALESIRLISIEAVQWRDASLGCPRPNARYAQVITQGFRVMLEAQGRTYEYHTDTGERVVLCQEGSPSYPLIPVRPGQIMDGKPWMPAD